MNKRMGLKRMLSLLLAAALVLSLCGCGRDSGGPAPDPESGEGSGLPQPVAEADSSHVMHNDTEISSHVKHNARLKEPRKPARTADSFDLYVTNAETMEGFVTGNIIGQYQEAVQGAFSVAGSQFDTLNGYAMEEQPNMPGSQWVRQEMDQSFLMQVLSREFYDGRPMAASGVLPTLFQSGTPFTENGVTMILTNFVEPGFDLSALALGIEDYFHSYADSAACVIGFTGEYNGDLYIPRQEKSKQDPTFRGVGCKAELPFYMVLVGPQTSVRNFTEALYKDLESRDVDFKSSNLFTNTVYEQILEQPLDFEVIGDRKVRSATTLLSSYNTGNMTQDSSGYAYYTTDNGVETSDYSNVESGIAIKNSSQIALFTTNYDGSAQYSFDTTLYTYNADTKTWTEASKNAATKAHFSMENMRGVVYDGIGKNEDDIGPMLLAAGRDELYCSAVLDFSDGVTLTRDQVYRLEVRIRLNRSNHDAASEAAGSKLAQMSISSAEYYAPLQQMLNDDHRLEEGNFKWFGYTEPAEKVLRKTPNLNAFLNRLAELEDAFRDAEETVQYLDFVFNLSGEKSKRGRG